MPDSTVISVRVTPRAARDSLAGWNAADQLVVRLHAPPVEGQANDALRRFLAAQLDLPLTAVELIAGARSRTKRWRIHGLTDPEVRARLQSEQSGGA